MKIKDGFVLKKVMGSYMIVPQNDSAETFGSMQTLNETGAFLWDELSTGCDADALLVRVTEEYDVDPTTAKKDIENFISLLKAAQLLED